MHLTEKEIAKIRPGKKREQYPDDETTGFGVRVDPTGRKSFYWFQKVNGTPRFRALGEFGKMSLADARAASARFSGAAAKWKLSGFEGPDPFEKVKPEPPASAPTFTELVNAYIENHVKGTANNPVKAEHDLRWMLSKHFSTWLDRPIDSIKVTDVLAVRNGLSKSPYMANRCVAWVRTFFSWSAGKKDGRVNFWPITVNPANDVEPFPEKKRKRFLQPHELAVFSDQLKKPDMDPTLRDFLVLAVSTGARKQNILSAKWSDISFELRTWHILQSKSDKSGKAGDEGYDVALTRAALEVFERRREQFPAPEPYVFPARIGSGHIRTGLERAWNAFRLRCGLPDIRIHDLRRTCGSYQAIAGVSLQQIGANLGHRSLSSTEIYSRLHAAALAEAREAGEAKMIEMERAARRRMRLAAKPKKLLKSAVLSPDQM